MTRLPILGFLFAAFVLLSGFTKDSAQPADERAAQNALPQAHDTLWKTLGAAKIVFNDETGTYKADFTPEIKKLVGTKIKISGFILPLESEENFTHFLLSKRTPTCAYCPPGDPNEIIEIFSAKPTEWDEGLVTYEGKFELINNQEFGLFYKINQAELVKTTK